MLILVLTLNIYIWIKLKESLVKGDCYGACRWLYRYLVSAILLWLLWGCWYDVPTFLTHRQITYVGCGLILSFHCIFLQKISKV